MAHVDVEAKLILETEPANHCDVVGRLGFQLLCVCVRACKHERDEYVKGFHALAGCFWVGGMVLI